MSQSTTLFTPVPVPAPLPEFVSRGSVDRLAEHFTAEELDAAMDRAARASHATVAVFAAAPIQGCADRQHQPGAVAIQFVVEFFVPPTSLDVFHRELEAQLLQLSPRYVAGRYRGAFGACDLHTVSFGTFHQYRVTCRASADDQRELRWSTDRTFLDGILHQGQIGWRELGDDANPCSL